MCYNIHITFDVVSVIQFCEYLLPTAHDRKIYKKCVYSLCSETNNNREMATSNKCQFHFRFFFSLTSYVNYKNFLLTNYFLMLSPESFIPLRLHLFFSLWKFVINRPFWNAINKKLIIDRRDKRLTGHLCCIYFWLERRRLGNARDGTRVTKAIVTWLVSTLTRFLSSRLL